MITYDFVSGRPEIFKWKTSEAKPVATTVGAPLMIEVPCGTLAGAGAAKMEARIRELLDDMMATLNKEFNG